MGHLADNIGRKKVEFASWVISLLGLAMLVGSGSSLYLVGLGSFLVGSGTNAAVTLHYTFLKELCLGSFRERSIIILQIVFSLGVSLVALSCLLIPNWKIVAGLCIGLPALAVTVFSFMIEETPHFSLKKGRMELLASLNRIARYNRRDELTIEDLDVIGAEEPAEEADHGYSLWDLFRYRSVRVMALVCAGMDMIIEFVYDGTLLSLDKIGEDVYVNQILVGLVEIGAAVFCSWVVVRVNRKPFSRYSLALIGFVSSPSSSASSTCSSATWMMRLMCMLLWRWWCWDVCDLSSVVCGRCCLCSSPNCFLPASLPCPLDGSMLWVPLEGFLLLLFVSSQLTLQCLSCRLCPFFPSFFLLSCLKPKGRLSGNKSNKKPKYVNQNKSFQSKEQSIDL